ncbi:MAG: thiamine pyrophosphate-binding protein [Ardenticatenaceae bacterium]|nr:thiamine pyrophosphate-binding protein [Ardenticatenaceae bacterium]HBY99122.1 acetolactate synthase [Chloroflexota bacterium]
MDTNTTRTGARFIAETLQGYGVTHVFYVDAILRKTMVDLEELGVRRVITHSEKAAAYMADGYARAAGRPGVCMAQSVGAANLAAGLQDAYLGLSPVIALTGKKPPLFQYRNAYQEVDHNPLFAPVTKYSADVVTLAQLPYLLRQAFREATSGVPGPVHLDVIGRHGRDLEAADGRLPVVIEELFTRYPAYRAEPEAASVARAAQAIAAAKRPVIVAGGGVRISAAADEVVALAEQTAIPVATSVNGKGTIAETHPLSMGVVGSYSARCANQVVAEADLVIYIGSNTGDQVTHNWTVPPVGTPVVQIDIDPAEIGRSYAGTIGIVADARHAVPRLAAALEGYRADPAWLQRVKFVVDGWRAEIAPLRQSGAIPIRPERLCKELTVALPENAMLISDTGYSAIWTATMVSLTHREQTFLRAAGSLGWAFPAALGAKCALPDRPVICFTGDGGFWYHLSELETARRHRINTVTIVNNNGGLAQGIDDIERMYGDRPGNPEELYRFEPVSFAQVAQDMGCRGIRVEHPDEIGGAIRQALTDERPVVVEVMTGLQYRAPEPWAPPG